MSGREKESGGVDLERSGGQEASHRLEDFTEEIRMIGRVSTH